MRYNQFKQPHTILKVSLQDHLEQIYGYIHLQTYLELFIIK